MQTARNHIERPSKNDPKDNSHNNLGFKPKNSET